MAPRAPSKGVPQKRGFWNRSLQYALIGAFLLAPLLALLVQLSRVPNEESAPPATVRPRALAPFIAGLLATPKPSEFECSLDEINVHLSQLLPPARKSASGVSFQRLTLRHAQVLVALLLDDVVRFLPRQYYLLEVLDASLMPAVQFSQGVFGQTCIGGHNDMRLWPPR